MAPPIYSRGPSTIALYYDKEQNLFTDEDGYIIYHIFGIVTPNDIYLFKLHKEYMLLKGVHGEMVELIWPDDDEEEEE